MRPVVVHHYPTWDLQKVLQAFSKAPFEPLGTVHLSFLTYKTLLLVAITLPRRISELAVLSVRDDLCVFHLDRAVLYLDPAFMPKINSWFHRAQELVFPDFCPNPLHAREALRIYIKRTQSFRCTEALCVLFAVSEGTEANHFGIGQVDQVYCRQDLRCLVIAAAQGGYGTFNKECGHHYGLGHTSISGRDMQSSNLVNNIIGYTHMPRRRLPLVGEFYNV